MNAGSHTDDPFDLVIVGAGIIGLACALALTRRHLGWKSAIVEKENDIAQHQSGHNSGVIHAGIYYTPGFLKARLCVEGARLLYGFCDEHEIPVRQIGKVIVATDEAELPGLRQLEHRGRQNRVPSAARAQRSLSGSDFRLRDRRTRRRLVRSAARCPDRPNGAQQRLAAHACPPARAAGEPLDPAHLSP